MSEEGGKLPEDGTPEIPPPPPVKRKRGFAGMDPAAVRAISQKGGRAAHSAGTAHEFTSEEARAAGRKGGLAVHAKKQAQK